MGILLLYNLVAILVALVTGVIVFFKWKFGYWERRGVKSLTPEIPFGNTKGLLLGKKSFAEQFQEIYFELRRAQVKHGGMYMLFAPHYIPLDPEIIKNIMQNDFQHFVNHGVYIDEETDPLTGHLFNLQNAKWKQMRVKLTPTFTSGKMKMMFQTLVDCTVGLQKIMDQTATSREAVDIKEVLGRFTTDIIGSCAFGIDCNSLKDPNSEFRHYGRRFFVNTPIERLKVLAELIVPFGVLKRIRFKKMKPDVEKFFMGAIKDTVEYREKNNIYRKDFMHLLLQLKNRGTVADDEKITSESGVTEEKALTLNELAAQAFVFFAAGFETSSTTMTFALYELATNPEVQTKLREEINSVLAKHENQVTYEAIGEMTYLEKVIQETLRKYPPTPTIRRKCNKDYLVPGTSVVIQKGTTVDIPIIGIHHDPEYYPDPEKFEPDRFSEEKKAERPAFTWLPFGEGPRMCIGLRFGVMQSKMGLTALLKNYNITLSDKTKTPLRFDKSGFILSTEGGIWLNVEKLS